MWQVVHAQDGRCESGVAGRDQNGSLQDSIAAGWTKCNKYTDSRRQFETLEMNMWCQGMQAQIAEAGVADIAEAGGDDATQINHSREH